MIALERIYAPEFFIVHAYGYVDSRAEHIDQLLARDSTDLLPLPTFTPPEELNVYGDVAVYRYAGATTIGTRALGMRVYVRRNGRWQITQTQSTEMIPAPQAVAVAAVVLDAYVRRYNRGEGRYVVIARDGDALVRILPGLPKVRFTPVSETRFVDRRGVDIPSRSDRQSHGTHATIQRSRVARAQSRLSARRVHLGRSISRSKAHTQPAHPCFCQPGPYRDRSASMTSPEACERPMTIDDPSRDQLAPRGMPAGRSISFRNGTGPRGSMIQM